MDWTSTNALNAVYRLLPGFLTAAIFFGLTAHSRKSPFERGIQALIFTAIIEATAAVLRYGVATWNPQVAQALASGSRALAVSLVLAAILGLVLVVDANHDWSHRLLRRLRVTSKSSHPSEWHRAFSRRRQWVVLHLDGGRRLFGWPAEWPDRPDQGHFLVDKPEWLLDDGTRLLLPQDEAILVRAIDVELVEFVPPVPDENCTNPRPKEENHGNKDAPAPAAE